MLNVKSCGAVVFRKNGKAEFLLLHYEAGHWDYVKGQVELKETERQTVLRELKEETGIANARFVEGFREEIRYFFKSEGKLVSKEVVYFLLEVQDREVRLSYEHIGYDWLGYEQALARLTFANAKRVLRKAFEFLITQGAIK